MENLLINLSHLLNPEVKKQNKKLFLIWSIESIFFRKVPDLCHNSGAAMYFLIPLFYLFQ